MSASYPKAFHDKAVFGYIRSHTNNKAPLEIMELCQQFAILDFPEFKLKDNKDCAYFYPPKLTNSWNFYIIPHFTEIMRPTVTISPLNQETGIEPFQIGISWILNDFVISVGDHCWRKVLPECATWEHDDFCEKIFEDFQPLFVRVQLIDESNAAVEVNGRKIVFSTGKNKLSLNNRFVIVNYSQIECKISQSIEKITY